MWWLYFSGDNVRAEAALVSASTQQTIRIALAAFFYAAIPMLLGVVAVAAGVKTAIGFGRARVRVLAALACLIAIPIGTSAGAVVELVVILAIFVGLITIDSGRVAVFQA
jgi:low temperature requirement protein LtrA